MILYFSGTGNTRYCAEHLGRMLDTEVRCFTVGELRQPTYARFSSADKDIILMTPVYSWGLPPVVDEVLSRGRFEFAKDARVWLVMTCGDDTGLAARRWRRIMRDQNLEAAAAFSVQMPNTYVCMKGFDVDSDEVAGRKVEAAMERLKDIAGRIRGGLPCPDDMVKGSWAWVKSYIVYPWFVRFCMSPMQFEHTDACTGCGLCARSCPMENIVNSVDGRPDWGKHCAFCLRCYHICPVKAVQYGQTTAGKGQWRGLLKPFQSVR